MGLQTILGLKIFVGFWSISQLFSIGSVEENLQIFDLQSQAANGSEFIQCCFHRPLALLIYLQTQQSSAIKVRAYFSIRATYKITFRIQKSNIGTVNCISFHYRIKRIISRFEFQVAHATSKVKQNFNHASESLLIFSIQMTQIWTILLNNFRFQ